jgi:LIVCS family branched-chain amino acid:cation transporter
MEKKIKATDILFIGLAFFATYFGAGNLIFPPMLGLKSGSDWGSGMIGMLISGVALPILAILIIGKLGSVQRITSHVHKKFYTVFIGMIMILCCCVSIPRTAAVGIEMGLQGIWSGAPYLITVVVYFVIAYFFAKDRGSALDKVGKILTPVMTVILFILVIKGAVSPIGTPAEPTVDNAFLNSFLGGYSTGDVLVSFLMATVFFSTIKNKGYEGKQVQKVNLGAGLVAALCLAVIYGGLLFMGACVSGEQSADIGNAALLLAVIRSSGGQIAIYGLCLSVILACLTTAIGQITAVADFFEAETNGKLPYKYLVIAVPVITTLVASLGLDTIVSLTSPWFSFTYPIALVLMILGVFEKVIPNDGCYKGATYLTVIYAFLDLPSEYGAHIGFLDKILNAIPLYSLGFGWIVPAIIGFIIGYIVYVAKHPKDAKPAETAA